MTPTGTRSSSWSSEDDSQGPDDRRATPEGGRCVVLDVSSIARWVGRPDGILRVEQALAAYALARRPEIVLAIYDTVAESFREVSPAWVGSIIGWDAAIDAVTLDHRRHWSLIRRLRSPRHPLLMALERRRLTARSAGVRRAMDVLQRIACLSRRLRPPFTGRDGRRRKIVPVDLALGRALSLGPQDTVITVGYDWVSQDPRRIEEQKRRSGFRYVAMCHDIVAFRNPEFLPDHVVAAFCRYWAAMFSIADRILLSSRAVEADIRDYCATAGIALADMRVVRFGFVPFRGQPTAQLPAGLERNRYVLFVSTIDPRKGHGMLVRLWARLLEAGVPQRQRFKLVFVGRRGWKVDALLGEIRSFAASEHSFVHLPDVDDSELAALYEAAAFCVYPSHYEGFGLPLIEAMAHGKATIASTRGALPETVDELSPCLDPDDEEAWLAAIRLWIEDPDARAPYEARIRSSFAWPDWTTAAAQIIEAACDSRITSVGATRL